MTSATRAWWWIRWPGGTSCCPARPGYSNNAACVGGGTFSYGAHGLALHGAGFPHALHLRRRGRKHAGRLAHRLRRPGALLREGRMGDRRFGRRCRTTPSKRRAASRCPCRRCRPTREYEILQPAAAKRLGLHPFDIPMLRNSVPYNGRRPACAAAGAWGIRLRSERQERHAEYRHSQSPGHRELRTAHRLPWRARSSPTGAAG